MPGSLIGSRSSPILRVQEDGLMILDGKSGRREGGVPISTPFQPADFRIVSRPSRLSTAPSPGRVPPAPGSRHQRGRRCRRHGPACRAGPPRRLAYSGLDRAALCPRGRLGRRRTHQLLRLSRRRQGRSRSGRRHQAQHRSRHRQPSGPGGPLQLRPERRGGRAAARAGRRGAPDQYRCPEQRPASRTDARPAHRPGESRRLAGRRVRHRPDLRHPASHRSADPRSCFWCGSSRR